MKFCPYCATAVVSPDDLFCGECGLGYPLPSKCKMCGEDLDPDANFCSYCGLRHPSSSLARVESPNSLLQTGSPQSNLMQSMQSSALDSHRESLNVPVLNVPNCGSTVSLGDSVVSSTSVNGPALFDVFGHVKRQQRHRQRSVSAPTRLGASAAEKKRHSAVPVWQPDFVATVCNGCNAQFSLFRRKHHCRSCGLIFCKGCLPHRRPVPKFGLTGNEFVCRKCNVALDSEGIDLSWVREEKLKRRASLPAHLDIRKLGMTYFDRPITRPVATKRRRASHTSSVCSPEGMLSCSQRSMQQQSVISSCSGDSRSPSLSPPRRSLADTFTGFFFRSSSPPAPSHKQGAGRSQGRLTPTPLAGHPNIGESRGYRSLPSIPCGGRRPQSPTWLASSPTVPRLQGKNKEQGGSQLMLTTTAPSPRAHESGEQSLPIRRIESWMSGSSSASEGAAFQRATTLDAQWARFFADVAEKEAQEAEGGGFDESFPSETEESTG